MNITQRQVTVALIGLLLLGTGLVLVLQLVAPTSSPSMVIGNIVGLIASIMLLLSYWRGWEYARHGVVILITLLVGLSMDEPYLTAQFTQAVFIPPVLALILVGPGWVLGSSIAVVVILIVRAGGQGAYTDPISLAIYGIGVGGIILARLVTNTAQRAAEEQARRAEEALARSEAQTAELEQKAGELVRQNDQQRRLIDLVATLETPAVALADGVLLAPVVGHLDSRRAEVFTERLLREIGESRARLVIIDIAGVPAVDTSVAGALMRAVQAVRLLGCDVAITGISAGVAATITQLGIHLAGVRTARTPQEALEEAAVGTARGARRN